MTLRELINSVDFEQYSDSPLYQKLRETKPEYGANRRIQVKLVNGEVAITNVHVGSLGDILTYQKAIADNRLCLFYIKAPDCGVCNVMLDKVERLADSITAVYSFYTDITEEPLIAGQFLVYSGPTVLLLMDGKEVYRASQFIDLEELKYNINRYIELLAQ